MNYNIFNETNYLYSKKYLETEYNYYNEFKIIFYSDLNMETELFAYIKCFDDSYIRKITKKEMSGKTLDELSRQMCTEYFKLKNGY